MRRHERGAGPCAVGGWTRPGRASEAPPASPLTPDAPVSRKQYLLAASATAALALGRLPAAFDLSASGLEVERLLLYSLTDAERSQYASAAYLAPRGRVLIPRTPHHVAAGGLVQPRAGGLRPLLRRSAPGDIDTPFTPLELEPLFLAPVRREEAPALLLSTSNAKLLALRTRARPTMAPPELTLEFERYALDHMGEEPALAEPLYAWAGGDELLTSASKRALGGRSAARMFALTRAARDYHLALYACVLRQHVARRVE